MGLIWLLLLLLLLFAAASTAFWSWRNSVWQNALYLYRKEG